MVRKHIFRNHHLKSEIQCSASFLSSDKSRDSAGLKLTHALCCHPPWQSSSLTADHLPRRNVSKMTQKYKAEVKSGGLVEEKVGICSHEQLGADEYSHILYKIKHLSTELKCKPISSAFQTSGASAAAWIFSFSHTRLVFCLDCRSHALKVYVLDVTTEAWRTRPACSSAVISNPANSKLDTISDCGQQPPMYIAAERSLGKKNTRGEKLIRLLTDGRFICDERN